MDNIDVLGKRPDRHGAFTKELLAETDDKELQQIVKNAARKLKTPIALVSLVLDHIQFFKAQYGLPVDLAASRGTRRDVSFCQFVVRDGKPFEVVDAENDARIPQHLVKEYNIQSYLGVPIHVNQTVVGSLCVIDTKKRTFTDNEHKSLIRLADLVNHRISILSEHRRQTRFSLTEKATGPALAEAIRSLKPVPGDVDSILQSLPAIRSFLRLSQFMLHNDNISPDAVERSLNAAEEALNQSEDALYDIASATGDCNDCIIALENLVTQSKSTRISEVVIAAQDLARHATESIGGMPLPDFEKDPVIYTPRPLAVALLTAALTTTASHIKRLGVSTGIRMHLHTKNGSIELDLSADKLSNKIADKIVSELSKHIGEDPAILICRKGKSVRLSFNAIE